VLKSYCEQLDLTSIEFDKALRGFLTKFRLPGEAQQIDRIMSEFTLAYYNSNPTLFPDHDTAYVLAFSLIMLNTDAHSSKIAANRKMTKEQFINSNREVVATLTEEYLGEMYDRIIA
jgi:Sec7-like guanine-nucleotide exchange factor